jgi:hypothetical protein
MDLLPPSGRRRGPRRRFDDDSVAEDAGAARKFRTDRRPAFGVQPGAYLAARRITERHHSDRTFALLARRASATLKAA